MKGKLTPHIIAVMALVVFVVLGLASTATTSSGPDPRTTDGKGGRIQIIFTGSSEYYLLISRDNSTNVTEYQLDPRIGTANNVQINEHDDCTVTVSYRIKGQNEKGSVKGENTSAYPWINRTVRLSNDERIEVTIPWL